MPTNQTISHEGEVVDILRDRFTVKIVTKAACASCHARGACSAFDSKEKLIDAFSTQPLQKGDKVRVELLEKHGWKALLYGIVIPFTILITVLLTVIVKTDDELMASLFSLASLVPYYFLLYLFRHRIEKEFVFNAVKIR